MESIDPDTGLLAIIAALRGSITEFSNNPKAQEYIEGVESKLSTLLQNPAVSQTNTNENSKIHADHDPRTELKSSKKRSSHLTLPSFDNPVTFPVLTFDDSVSSHDTDSTLPSSLVNLPVPPLTTKKPRLGILHPSSTFLTRPSTGIDELEAEDDTDLYDIDRIAKSILSVSIIEAQITSTEPHYQTALPLLLTSIPATILPTVLLSMNDQLRQQSTFSASYQSVKHRDLNVSVSSDSHPLPKRASGGYPPVKRSLSPVVLSQTRPMRSTVFSGTTERKSLTIPQSPVVLPSYPTLPPPKPRSTINGTLRRLETIVRPPIIPVSSGTTNTPTVTPKPFVKKVTFSTGLKNSLRKLPTPNEVHPPLILQNSPKAPFLTSTTPSETNSTLSSKEKNIPTIPKEEKSGPTTTTFLSSTAIPLPYAGPNEASKKSFHTSTDTELAYWQGNDELIDTNTGLPLKPKVRTYGSKGTADYVGRQIFSSSF